MIIATNIHVSERASDGTRTLYIASNKETTVVEISPQLWEKLSDTAKWFHAQEKKADV